MSHSHSRGAVAATWMLGVAGIGVGLALAYAARKHDKIPPPREVINDLLNRIHRDYIGDNTEKNKERAAQLQLNKEAAEVAEKKNRIEQILDADLEEEDELNEEAQLVERRPLYHYNENIFSSVPSLTSDTFPLTNRLSYRSLSYLNFIDITILRRVNKRWLSFSDEVRKDRSFLHGCALRGFPDGITGESRGKIWQILCGADQLMASMFDQRQAPWEKTMYWELVDQAKRTGGPEFEEMKDVIGKDIGRTIVHLSAFTNVKEAESALTDVLCVYALSDPEVGYTQGMNFVAGFLLTKMPEEAAYWTLHTLMFSFKYDLRKFYLNDLSGLLIFKYQFNILFAAFLPNLYAHFMYHNIYNDIFTEWWMTCFCYRGFPRMTCEYIWDLFMIDGSVIFHKIALAILKLSQDILLEYDFESIVYYIKSLPDEGILQHNLLIPTAMSFRITQRMLKGLERQYYLEQEGEIQHKAQEQHQQREQQREQQQQHEHSQNSRKQSDEEEKH